MVENIHKVEEGVWNSWSKKGKKLFNHLYSCIVNDQLLYSHPKAAQQIDEYWGTTAWNAAWIAAEYISRSKK